MAENKKKEKTIIITIVAKNAQKLAESLTNSSISLSPKSNLWSLTNWDRLSGNDFIKFSLNSKDSKFDKLQQK